ncbi:histone-lysine N-methyltransferase SETMAR [Trichonephila clavipes]|nr:histone-lysine N-methyltransferase SETMAR [Trichonephila clavipes]
MPTMVKSQRAVKKVMYAVFFRSTGLIKSHQVGKTEDSNSKMVYHKKCLPEILQEVNVRELMLHHDNASPHTAELTAEFLKQKQIKKIEHTPYSPDLAMCDFWLVINLKKNLRECRFQSEENIDVVINVFFMNSKK